MQQLEYRDSEEFLRALRALELDVASSSLDAKVKALRTNKLKHWKEAREAALFCHGMSQKMGVPISFCPEEAQDYDFIATWTLDDVQHFVPVQLKELVPENLNDNSCIERVLQGLTKYVDSEDLTVAIYLNRAMSFDLNNITIPSLSIGALWVFGSISADQSSWGLWGNLLEQSEGIRFEYPA